MGAETLIHLMEDGQDLRAVVPRRVRAGLGERVHVRCRAGQVHVFGADGRRVHGPEHAQRAPAPARTATA